MVYLGVLQDSHRRSGSGLPADQCGRYLCAQYLYTSGPLLRCPQQPLFPGHGYLHPGTGFP